MDERPRIHITCLHLSYGGVERVISSLANAFADRGYPVEILCTYRFGDPFYRLDDRVTITYLTKLVPNKKDFLEAVKDKKINRILLEGFRSIYILFCKKMSMIRKISSIHEGVVISTRHEHTKILSRYGNRNVLKIAQHNDHKFNKKLIREIRRRYKNIEYFTLLTKQAQTEMESILDGYNHYTKCVYIPNFISSETRAVPRGTKRKKQVVAVGRLHPIKGFDDCFDYGNCDKTIPIVG
jgi:N-acetylglucosaminyldiphosphoundecaprenol N-acetyl-beta-D-mannosaminyltransferase